MGSTNYISQLGKHLIDFMGTYSLDIFIISVPHFGQVQSFFLLAEEGKRDWKNFQTYGFLYVPVKSSKTLKTKCIFILKR